MKPVKTKWVIQDLVHGEDILPIIDALNETGTEYTIMDSKISYKSKDLILYGEFDCVFTYGSIQFARTIQTYTRWCPGAVYDSRDYDMCNLVSRYQDQMFNHDGVFMTHGQFSKLPCVNSYFVRPNDGNKLFSGQLIGNRSDRIYLESKCKVPELLWVASPKKIHQEFRLIVRDKKIITGCQYGFNSNTSEYVFKEITDSDIARIQSSLVLDWTPDKMFVMDVHEDEQGKITIVEFNALSTSGWYCSDILKIVKNINEMCEETFREEYGSLE